MRPTWLVEADVFGVESEALRAEVRRQGMAAHVVKCRAGAPPPRDLLGAEALPPDGCVIFVGTMPVMRHVQLHRRWMPGGWFSAERLACSVFHAHLGPWLLNQDYTLLPGVEAIRHADRLFATFGRDGQVFARPDSVWKTFPGALVRRAAFESALAPTRYDPATLVLIARPRVVGREWRLVVANGTVVAASLYRERGANRTERGCPDEVSTFAARILEQVAWRPDPLFMLDVCDAEDGLRIVELNSFSCSGLYACDLASVVAAASACASSAA